jgi:FkbM family methyltransferase
MDNRLHLSQYDQCKILDSLIYEDINNTNKKGYFIEVGAYDGYQFSNTYWFEKYRDWNGLVIEPIPHLFDKIQHNRWCDSLNGAVYIKDGSVDFLHVEGYSEMISGISEAYHTQYYERVKREIEQHKQKTRVLKVPCFTLNTIMSNFNVRNNRKSSDVIDYLSLDCQTAEVHVLNNYDIDKNPCKVISIDLNGFNKIEILDWFNDNGYKQFWKHQHADEYMFINDKLPWSWNRL